MEPVFGGLWARNVSIGRRAVVTGKGGADRTTKYESVPPEQSIRMHATRGSTHTVTVPLPYRYRTVPPTSSPKAKLRTDQCAHARCARSRMLTRAGAQPKRGRDSQPDRAQAEDLALVAQPEARPQDELLAHAQAQSFGAQPAEEREPGHSSPHARQATASEQRAAAGISPGGRPVAPPGLGRLVCSSASSTPVGENGIDETPYGQPSPTPMVPDGTSMTSPKCKTRTPARGSRAATSWSCQQPPWRKRSKRNHDGKQAAWAKASSAISQAVAQRSYRPRWAGTKGGAIITGRYHANRTRTACQLVGALSLLSSLRADRSTAKASP